MKPKKTSSPFPAPPQVHKLWDESNESVGTYNDKTWRIRDLRAVVKNEPVFDLPLSLMPFGDFDFKCPDLMAFAQHMLHCQEADLSIPIIMDEKGRIMDGRHRMVKALLEGRESLPCVKVPQGTLPTC